MHTSLMLLHHVLAAGSTPAATKKGSGLTAFLPLVVIFGIVYFLFLRPRNRRRMAAANTRRAPAVGDEVTTTSGLIATVVAVDDDFLTLEVAPGVQCRYVPAAVLRVNGDDEEPADPDASDTGLDASTHEVIDQPDTAADADDALTDPTDTPDESAPA